MKQGKHHGYSRPMNQQFDSGEQGSPVTIDERTRVPLSVVYFMVIASAAVTSMFIWIKVDIANLRRDSEQYHKESVAADSALMKEINKIDSTVWTIPKHNLWESEFCRVNNLKLVTPRMQVETLQEP